ncbi:hypothetical protein [Candidatus Nitrospira nitrificans]|uniref:Uncharacterized protein n=1 Tax=Candidatus Nitrospira nitrificans TaxID=1742973 RepID=A0A0S4LLN5_9BACT|nr:hypothetical protein [Candidatus Nitrospira nitrificans]CUS38444.1 membrane hypothetical protein [Candidatus Nitrospira nitrificans]
MGARRWVMEYGVALVLAFLFSMILGQVSLFRETSVGKLRASDLVQLVGYSASVVIGWLGARELARNPPLEWKWLVPFQGLVVPLATLLAITIAYGVLLFALDPFLGKLGKAIYNWVFILAIVADSIWLILSWVWKCAPLVAAMKPLKPRKAV